MKKSLIALAALAATGAFAQSSVTLYGVVDLGISHGAGKGTGSTSITQMTSGNINSSRLGVKGTEDLGNGLKTTFVFEGDVKPNSGTGATSGAASVNSSTNNLSSTSTTGGFSFNRQATVGVAGGFGEVRLGRDYTPTFYVDATYDPFGVNGVGTNAIFGNGLGASVNHLRASNSVSYFLPGNLNGFSGQVMYAYNNTATNGAAAQNDGKYTGGVVGYANGPVSVHVATAKFTLSTAGDVKTDSVGAAYDLGVVKLSAEYSADKKGALALNNKATGTLFGLTAPMGSGSLRASYVSRKVTQDGQTADNKFDQASIGYVYNLSPRTALYGTFSSISNKGLSAVGANGAVTAAGQSATGYDLGIRHAF
jgi:predicted porin